MKVVFFSFCILVFLFGMVSFCHTYNKTIHWEIDIAKKAKSEDQLCLPIFHFNAVQKHLLQNEIFKGNATVRPKWKLRRESQ